MPILLKRHARHYDDQSRASYPWLHLEPSVVFVAQKTRYRTADRLGALCFIGLENDPKMIDDTVTTHTRRAMAARAAAKHSASEWRVSAGCIVISSFYFRRKHGEWYLIVC